MGGNYTVGSAKERVSREHRFDAYDVTAKACKKTAVQSFSDCCLINDRSSCNVKKDGTGFEKSQGFLVDDLSCLFCQRTVEGYDIGVFDAFFKIQIMFLVFSISQS